MRAIDGEWNFCRRTLRNVASAATRWTDAKAIAPLTRSVSSVKYRVPQAQKTPAIATTETTTMNAASHDTRAAMAPRTGGEIASPSAWMKRMISAKAVARTLGCVTFARMVLLGPVLKNRKNSATKTATHAAGNGRYSIAMTAGQARKIPTAET